MTGSTTAVAARYLTGIGVRYPPHLLGPEKLEQLAGRFYNVESPGLKKLLHINRLTGIRTRSAIRPFDTGLTDKNEIPSIQDLDEFFRDAGVDLATHACLQALETSHLDPADISHTVAVTCTNQGNPGFDMLVCARLQIPAAAQHLLLHGVGCAGGLAIMRAAAQIADAATLRRKPARILAFACELCTPNVRHLLAEAQSCTDPKQVPIAGALFSDAAAAFVMCNDIAIAQGTPNSKPLLQVVEWESATVPDTLQHMTYYTHANGFRTILDTSIPAIARDAAQSMFLKLLPLYQEQVFASEKQQLTAADFTWALHPGGKAIIDGVGSLLGLETEHLRAAREIYSCRGNSSSPTVLAVIERVLSSEKQRDHIAAVSFGPGIVVEMVLLRRCGGSTIFEME